MIPRNQHGKDQEGQLKDWLTKLQENSWNLELLISAFTIFGLVQLNGYLGELLVQKSVNSFSSLPEILEAILPSAIMAAKFGSEIFLTGLIVHVFLRGLWIGSLGLRYVSGDIDYGVFRYNKRQLTHLKKKVGSFDRFIISLESVSSLIFPVMYLVLFSIISFFIYMFLSMGLFVTLFGNQVEATTLKGYIAVGVLLCFTLIGLVYVVDFITFGSLKRIKKKWFSVPFFWVGRIVGMMSLSFLWRPLWYNFIDERRLRRFIWLFFPLLNTSYYLFSSNFESSLLFPKDIEIRDSWGVLSNYLSESHLFKNDFLYDDLRSSRKNSDEYIIEEISLKNWRVSEDYMELFLVYNQEFEQTIMWMDTTIVSMNDINEESFFYKKSKFNKIKKIRRDSFYQQHSKLEGGKKESYEDRYRVVEEDIYFSSNERILILAKNLICLSIDQNSIAQDEVSILFARHPNQGEMGFWVFFPLPELRDGLHTLEYERYIETEKTDAITKQIVIPFLKVAQ